MSDMQPTHATPGGDRAGAAGDAPATVAERAARAMWSGDAASKWFGIERGRVTEGGARMTLDVAPHHCNGHGTCHGGVIFALADTAFAFACNSRNQATVAMHCVVSFMAPARAGDRLEAVAEEVDLTGRNGIYDVTVLGPDGHVAHFRGISRTIPGRLYDPAEGAGA